VKEVRVRLLDVYERCKGVEGSKGRKKDRACLVDVEVIASYCAEVTAVWHG
jgi:hypothetical protein